MKVMFIQITQIWVHYFKSFYKVEKSQDEKTRFIKGNELKLTQVELFSFLFFKWVFKHKLEVNVNGAYNYKSAIKQL